MINRIFENENPAPKNESDFEDFWGHVRETWKIHEAAIEKLTGTEVAGFRNIVTSMLSTETNNVFSPCAIYVGLLFLASLCSGVSKKELLAAVSCDEKRAQGAVENVKSSIIGDAGVSTCTLSNSLWINDHAPLFHDVIKDRCKKHQADVFSGTMGSEEMNSAIQAWVNTHTGNLLTQQSAGIQTDLSTAMEMLITSYFKSDWDDKFWPDSTKTDTFHVDSQTDVVCDFMNGREQTRCMCGHQFIAVSKELQLDYQMWFIRPNDGVELRNLVGSEVVGKLLANPAEMPLEQFVVSMSIPKFDVSSEIDMTKAMNAMGIKSVFDEIAVPFAQISNDPRLFLSKADHAARVKINEDGVEASSYVGFGIACAGLPPEIKRMNFKLDRPFLFAITKKGKIPLYVGTVINPLEK